MATAKHFSAQGQEKGTVELSGKAFEAPARPDVVYDALRSYMANQRQGTVATKTRSLVSGGGKKPWRQKGTGRARHSSIRSPIWVGGGIVFGPQPRDYSYSIPRKMKTLAIRSVLSERVRDGKVFVIDDIAIDAPKTKAVASVLKAMNLGDTKVLIIGGEPNLNLYRSVRNIRGAQILPAAQLNVYNLLEAEAVVLTTGGLEKLKEVGA